MASVVIARKCRNPPTGGQHLLAMTTRTFVSKNYLRFAAILPILAQKSSQYVGTDFIRFVGQ